MATRTVPQTPRTTTDEAGAKRIVSKAADFLTEDRVTCALQASWEAEGCAMAALDLMTDVNDSDGSGYPVRALLMRLRDLSRVVMGSLADEDDDIERIRRRLASGEGR